MDMTRMLGPGEGYEADTQQHEERGHNPLLVLHLLLQGRYMLAVVLALVFGAAAAVAGYQLTHPTFSCTGIIQIRPVISPVLFNGSGTMPMYEQFVKNQVVMIKIDRCIDLAMASPQWLDGSRRSNSREAKASFINHLDVTADSGIIRVVFTDPDAETAKAAVGVVIYAYQQLNNSNDDMVHDKGQLDELKIRYETALAGSQTAIDKLCRVAGAVGLEQTYTAAALDNRYSFKVSEAEAAEMQYHLSVQAVLNWELQHGMKPEKESDLLKSLETQSDTSAQPAAEDSVSGIGAAPSSADKKGDAATPSSRADKQPGAVTSVASAKDPVDPVKAPAAGPVAAVHGPQVAATEATKPAASQPRPRTPEEIARADGQMRDLLQAQHNAQSELEQLRLKVGPNHPLVQGAQKQVDYWNEKVAEYVANWKPLAEIAGMPEADTAVALVKLKEKVFLDHADFVKIDNEANELGNRVSQIQSIEKSDELMRQWLTETKQKLEEISISLNNPGRILLIIEVLGNDRPVYKDKRIPAAAASGFGGGIFGFSIIIVWGLLDRRLRTIDHARMSLKQGMRVLGMLPSLPKNLEDPSAASFAALCVHHIRMLLQVMPRLDGHPAIAITSPSPGDGKTSLTMALALSYAASGKSTLLIDCDIVGAGMTRRVNAIIRRRVGQILIRENLLTAAELREALSAAQRTGRKLGEVLVDEGDLWMPGAA